ncbi:hypothetical protein [Microbacterium lacticum]
MRVNLSQLTNPNAVMGMLMNLATVETDPREQFAKSEMPHWIPPGVAPAETTDEDWILRVAGISTELADRSADIRACLTAYSQAVANKRPELQAVALWQRVSASALRHRYNALHVQAVRELLKEEPLIDIVLEPFISVVDRDLAGINEQIDAQLELRAKMRSAVASEFDAAFTNRAAVRLRMTRSIADQYTTRLIDDLAPSITVALERRAPELLPVFDEWHRRFEARPLRLEDVKPTSTRVRRTT